MSGKAHTQVAKPAPSIQLGSRNPVLQHQRTAWTEPVGAKETTPSTYDKFKSARSASNYPILGYNFAHIPVSPTTRVSIQPKFRINEPGDMYEQEADRVADTVMRMPQPAIQRKTPHPAGASSCEEEEKVVQTKPLAITLLVQRQVAEAKEEGKDKEEEAETRLQRKQMTGANPEPSPIQDERINAFSGSGQPLPEASRAFFEPRFGHDFSKVRVHYDTQAFESARAVNAFAYTVGQDVVFGAGAYQPGTSAGNRVLAHELTHVVQQDGDPVRRPSLSKPEDECEREADPVATTILQQEGQIALKARGVFIGRQVKGGPKKEATEESKEHDKKTRAESILSTEDREWIRIRARLGILVETRAGGLTLGQLAEWLFDEKVWAEFCSGFNIAYPVHTAVFGAAVNRKLFEKPDNSEKANWRETGALSYLRKIHTRLNDQVGSLAGDLDLFTGGPGHGLSLQLLKTRIREYQKAWEELGGKTGTMEVIKNKILLPGELSGKGKELRTYFWNENERMKLPRWRDTPD